jgi:two-component system cell cycle response regulator
MLQTVRRGLWPPVDPALVDAGRGGELAVARARIAIMALMALSPAAMLIRHPSETPAALALVIEILFVALAVTILQLARRHPQPAWLGFAAAALDVTFVTVAHALIVVGGFAVMAPTSRVTFALYLLAILATSLRNDGRVATFCGALASVAWLGLTQWGNLSEAGQAAGAGGGVYGDVGTDGQIQDLIIIAAATALSRTIVSRARSLRLSSTRDNLTGLLNRAHFEERLGTELMRSARHQRPLALALIDLDQFHGVNDSAGQLAGDEVLCEVASRLRRTVRRTDLTARFGADEFALVFIDTTVAHAAAKLEEIRRTVSAPPIPLRVHAVVTVTCSAGVAVAPLDGSHAGSLIAVAEARLSAAKKAGRDRSMVAG